MLFNKFIWYDIREYNFVYPDSTLFQNYADRSCTCQDQFTIIVMP